MPGHGGMTESERNLLAKARAGLRGRGALTGDALAAIEARRRALRGVR